MVGPIARSLKDLTIAIHRSKCLYIRLSLGFHSTHYLFLSTCIRRSYRFFIRRFISHEMALSSSVSAVPLPSTCPKAMLNLGNYDRTRLLTNEKSNISPRSKIMVVASDVCPMDTVPWCPPQHAHKVAEAFEADTNEMKFDLGVRAYRTEELHPYVLNVVKKAEKLMLERGEDKEYLPIDGLDSFNKVAAELVFGANNTVLEQQRVATFQTLSGTGALRLGAELIAQFFPEAKVLLSSPTWGNHKPILDDARVPWSEYRYYDKNSIGLDFDGMISDLKGAPEGSFVMLHACAHNPTGFDLTTEQWEIVANVVQEKKHIPFLDIAYQGFASGDLEIDASSVRLFAAKGMDLFVAQSFGKNMGLYGERIGALHVLCSSSSAVSSVKSQLTKFARVTYSTPPIHGARIVATILRDPALFGEWKEELYTMVSRITEVKRKLFECLSGKDKSGKDWSFLLRQVGFFSYSGLNKAQSENMLNKWRLYMTNDGRISLGGLSSASCEYIADAMIDSFHNVK